MCVRRVIPGPGIRAGSGAAAAVRENGLPVAVRPVLHDGMVSPDRLAAFAALSLLLIVVPGPSVLFVIGRALAHGRRAALTTVAGNTLGAYVLVVAVALGIGSIVERSPSSSPP